VARVTGGRFYDVTDPHQLPQIFIKEAQVVRRSLIVEKTFSPIISYWLSEVAKGLNQPLPNLDGYILTGPRGGLTQVVLASDEADPILATCQSGLGRCAAFTSSADSQWASNWLQWGGFDSFWEQIVRWAAKPSQSSDCEVFADIQGRSVTINVEAIDAEGKFLQLANIDGQVIGPDVSVSPLELAQIGPGQYRGHFQAGASGSYVVNLRYRKLGEALLGSPHGQKTLGPRTHLIQTTVTIPFAPEFRDLCDNAPLLKEVSDISGGRILSSDPNQAELFNYGGVKFPETNLPLNRYLMFVWLALFLLDVAVRRISVDVRAVLRWFGSLIRSFRREREGDETLERLRLTRRKLREQLSARPAEPTASARYKAGEKYRAVRKDSIGEQLPIAGTKHKTRAQPERPTEKSKPQEKKTETEPTHIDQLLRAKKKAFERHKKDEPENKK